MLLLQYYIMCNLTTVQFLDFIMDVDIDFLLIQPIPRGQNFLQSLFKRNNPISVLNFAPKFR